jgi:hypothetical protein
MRPQPQKNCARGRSELNGRGPRHIKKNLFRVCLKNSSSHVIHGRLRGAALGRAAGAGTSRDALQTHAHRLLFKLRCLITPTTRRLPPLPSMSAAPSSPQLQAAQRLSAALSRQLRALLSDHNVHVTQKTVDAIMPSVRELLEQALALESGAGCKAVGAAAAPVPEADSRHDAADASLQHQLLPPTSNSHLPEWFSSLLTPPHSASLLLLPEWSSSSFRASNGWSGTDFVHAASSPLRVIAYALVNPPSASTSTYPSLIGVAHFSLACESHKRFCHGKPPPPPRPPPTHTHKQFRSIPLMYMTARTRRSSVRAV